MIRMNRFLIVFVFFLLSVVQVSAQSAESDVVVISFDDDAGELYMPPELYVDIDFDDADHNQILEAEEAGEICLRIRNKGGAAERVSVKLEPEKAYDDLFIENNHLVTDIPKMGEVELTFPISAGIGIATDSLRFNISVSEPLGYDMKAFLTIRSFEFQKAEMKIAGVVLLDSGKGLRANGDNPDGKLQRGEVVRAIVTLQNVGRGVADDVAYEVYSADPDVYLMNDSGSQRVISGVLGEILPGEACEVSFRLSANNHYSHNGKFIPVYLTTHEKYGFGDMVSVNVPIPLDEIPDKPVLVSISGDLEKLQAKHQAQRFSSSEVISSHSQIRDISLAPSGEPLYTDAIAIVIGAEANSYDIAPAPYASRDARVITEYFKNSLGVSHVLTITDSEVTKNRLSDIFDSRIGVLKQEVKPGKTDVFVYYSGHGIPDVSEGDSQDVFLVPFDARKDMIRERGYSLNDLYADLNSLDAKSVTVILDACFSGVSRSSSVYLPQNISNVKGVRISHRASSRSPWVENPSFRLFTSSTEDQTSFGYDRSQSGLFTYFLARGMQGDADSDGDGVIYFNELVKYVTDNVTAEARKICGGAQTPQFYGDGDFILEKLK